MRNEKLREVKATLRGFFAKQDDAYLTRVFSGCRDETFGVMEACYCLVGLMDGGYAENWTDNQDAECALLRLSGPQQIGICR